METKGNIGQNEVVVEFGDITKNRADAYVVPQFTGGASYGGVGGSIARSGAKNGLDLYQKFVDEKGEQKFGTVLLTESGGGNAKQLLHVVSVGSGNKDEFNTIQTAFYNVLKVAESKKLKEIAAPAMGTGIIGELTSEQSARAMMSALEQYSKEGGKPIKVSFVIYGDKSAYEDFATTLKSASYKETKKEAGGKEFDMGEWVVGMAKDADANRRAFSKKHTKRDPLNSDGNGWDKGKQ
ncbi:MAG: macro domain-containing protein [Rickettsiales bacterium]